MSKVNKNKKRQKAGSKGRKEGYKFEDTIMEAINKADCNGIVASKAKQNVRGTIAEKATNKSDIEISNPNSDTPIGISIKNPKSDSTTIQMQIIKKEKLLDQLNKVKLVPQDVKDFFSLFLGNKSGQVFKSDCDRLGVDYDSLDYQEERRRHRALWDSIPAKYCDAFLSYFNDIAIKREILEVVFKRGVTASDGVSYMVWCQSSLAGKSNADNLVGYPVDVLINEVCNNFEWEPNYHKGRASAIYLGPLALQMKGSGGIEKENYHNPQFRASLNKVLEVLPESVVVKARAAEIMPALYRVAA